jgi:uncharacterized membrane protein YdbT with pleckstrin-like domain
MAKLNAGRKVLYQSYPRMFREKPGQFLLYVLLIPALGFGLYLLIRWWIQNYSTRLAITESVVIYMQGIFNTKRTEVRMSDIRTVHIEQSFLERILRTGSIMISSAGSDGYEVEIHGMPNPAKVRRLIDQFRRISGDSPD